MDQGTVEATDIVWRGLRFLENETTTDDGNATSSMMDEGGSEDGGIIYDDGQVLRDTMVVYGSTLLVIILVFCWARRRFPKVYNLRKWVYPIKSPLAEESGGFFSWIWKVYMVTDDELLDECGMDALCFIRIAQMGFKLA